MSVIANSKLSKKKQSRKAIDFEYNLDALSFDDEWPVVNDGNEDEMVGVKDLNIPNELSFAQVGEDDSGVDAPLDDLEILTHEDGRDQIEDDEYYNIASMICFIYHSSSGVVFI